jgi:hypothetical protein
MYSTDAVTEEFNYTTAGTFTALSSSLRTIVGIAAADDKQDGSSDLLLKCGTTEFAHYWGRAPMNYDIQVVCNNTINVVKTGNTKTTLYITYVPRNISLIQTMPVTVFTGTVEISSQSALAVKWESQYHSAVFVIVLGFIVLSMTIGALLGRLMFPKNL